MDSMNSIDLGRLQKYLDLTQRAREKATPISRLTEKREKELEMLLKMVDDYASDANHFRDKGDLIRAFGAINYAHAWIDAAVRLGLLNAHDDDELFTLP